MRAPEKPLGKLFGPIGLSFGIATGEARPEGIITCIPNDLIWWVPFGLILLHAYRAARSDAAAGIASATATPSAP